MPSLGSVPDADYDLSDENEDFGRPEDEPLLLPAELTAEQRVEMQLDTLSSKEYLLRRSGAERALGRMKVAIQAWNSALMLKQTEVVGQHRTTRAEQRIAAHMKEIRKYAGVYRRHYCAMTALGLDEADSTRFQVLTDDNLKHLNVHSARPHNVGEVSLPQAWFWGGDRDADDPGAEALEALSREGARSILRSHAANMTQNCACAGFAPERTAIDAEKR